MRLLLAASTASAVLGHIIDVSLTASDTFELASTASLTCEYKFALEGIQDASESPKFELTWAKDNNALVTFSAIEDYLPIAHHGSAFAVENASLNQTSLSSTLQVPAVSVADAGNYACKVRLLKSLKLEDTDTHLIESYYFSSRASHQVDVFNLPSITADFDVEEGQTPIFDTRNHQADGSAETATYKIASCAVKDAYPMPESVNLHIGNRIIESSDITPVQNQETLLWSIAEVIFTENLQGQNDGSANVSCSVSHNFWPSKVTSAGKSIEVLWLPTEALVHFNVGEGRAFALENEEVSVSCEANANPEAILSLHEGGYVEPVVEETPEVLEDQTSDEVAEESNEEINEESNEETDEESNEETNEESNEETNEESNEESNEETNDETLEEITNRRRREVEEQSHDHTEEIATVGEQASNETTKVVVEEFKEIPAPVVVPSSATYTASRSGSPAYQCRASGPGFPNYSVLSEKSTLPVYYMDAPVFSGPSGRHSTGANLDFSCTSDHNLGDHQITYQLNHNFDGTLQHKSMDAFTADKNSAGEYSCTASVDIAGIPPQTSSNSVSIEIAQKCVYNADKVDVKSKQVGDKLVTTMTCPVNEGDGCTVDWVYNRSLGKGKVVGDNQIKFENLKVLEPFRVSCIASNEMMGSSPKLYAQNSDIKTVDESSNLLLWAIAAVIAVIGIIAAYKKMSSKGDKNDAAESVQLN